MPKVAPSIKDVKDMLPSAGFGIPDVCAADGAECAELGEDPSEEGFDEF
jgi:hypothetical protein